MTAWTTLATSAVDADSPGDVDLAQALVDRNQHLYEFLGGGSTRYDLRTPHDHAGVHDALIRQPSSPNLLVDPVFENTEFWSQSGTTWDGTNDSRALGASASDYMLQHVCSDEFGNRNVDIWGTTGTYLMASFYARATGSLTQGSASFGFCDNDVAPDAGYTWALDYTDLTTSWKRFYVYADDSGSFSLPGNSSDFLITMSWVFAIDATPFDSDILVSAMSVNVSKGTLCYFNYGPQEMRADAYGVHDNDTVSSAPIFDTTVGITNAVNLSSTRA